MGCSLAVRRRIVMTTTTTSGAIMPIRYKLLVNAIVFFAISCYMSAQELKLVAPNLFGV